VIVRALLQTFFHLYFRFQRIGRQHIPRTGPVIVAANHRSFLDPWVIACMARRPMYYMAKREIFQLHPLVAWILTALGAFPVDRGAGDGESIATAKAILARGGIVLMFPEGTRTRPGALGRPKRGAARLALETGAPVVPIAVFGTEAVRKGWRIRPHKVRIRAGRPLRFPHVEQPSASLAAAVMDRIWPCVMLQWEWLGGMAPVRRTAIVGAGTRGTELSICLARAGVEVDLCCRTAEQAQAVQGTRVNERYLPGVALPAEVRIIGPGELDYEAYELVCFTVPASALPAALGDHGSRIPDRAGVLVLCEGMVPPLGTLPSAFAAERCNVRGVAVLGGPAAADRFVVGASVVVASIDKAIARLVAEPLRRAGLDVSITNDVTGVELAGCAQSAAALAATVAASEAGASVAGAAAGKVFAEVGALARTRGGRPETFAGVAGAGALLTSVISAQSAEQRAAERIGPGGRAPSTLGSVRSDAAGSIALLATAARKAHLEAPALNSLAALMEGRIEPAQWALTVTDPGASEPAGPPRAA
jgi:1-acyl-sn-glycerol-3-phosphate acyltransferase